MPLNVIIHIESLTAKLVHSVLLSNTVVYSNTVCFKFFNKGDVCYPASARLQCIANQSSPVMWYKCRQAQHMCSMFTLSYSAGKPICGYAVFMQTSLFRYCLLVAMVKPVKFKMEQSTVKLIRLKSLFIDKSLRQVVFELWAYK